MTAPQIPAGSGRHPIVLVTIAARDLAASSAFYRTLFGWQLQPMSPTLTAAIAPSGPSLALNGDVDEGAPGAVPFIAVDDVAGMLARVEGAGGALVRAPWSMPMVGTMARFTDPWSTHYGLIGSRMGGAATPVPIPMWDNPRPTPGGLCSVEMYAADGAAAGRFFGDLFGWGSVETMPSYLGFDPGAGIGGVFQSHTPVAPVMPYLFVDDVAATLSAIDAAGGTRMGDAMPLPGVATFGYFHDPSGTAMGLIGP
ncbi:MAG: hypothetical protein MUE41_17695 [Gemmatimonadaceae bacterium]|jgi:predicted enzyme related to lactoylglutathione lyase|nr:hypothetical protein [Gemmatimonadaceae bacterium]